MLLGKLIGLGIVMVIGFGLTIRGNPSYWQIIGLVLMMIPVGVAPVLQMSEKKDNE
ncbi:hypothetical protein ALPO108162_03410 [Alicyclobacillus pomorum]